MLYRWNHLHRGMKTQIRQISPNFRATNIYHFFDAGYFAMIAYCDIQKKKHTKIRGELKKE